MKIYTDTPEGTTVIQNTFIDQYMPHANGEFVKVYLYLLRCANTGRELSLSSIADVFDYTEKDIQRALSYWERQSLLQMKLASDGTLISVTFCDSAMNPSIVPAAKTPVSGHPDTVFGESLPEVAVTHASESSPARPSERPNRDRVTEAIQEEELQQLFYVAEQYLKRPLTSAEQSDFIYYYDNLSFSTDLIEYLLEYSISKGCTSRHYMKKVALAWAEAGISTVLQAKQESNLHNKRYFAVLNTFGIKGRNPATSELEFMERWFRDFGFTIDIVLEACNRTIRQTHQPNFQYADKILEQWHANGVTTTEAIEKLDEQYRQEQKKNNGQPQQRSAASGNRFHNFSQRDYNFDQLEKKLLGQ